MRAAAPTASPFIVEVLNVGKNVNKEAAVTHLAVRRIPHEPARVVKSIGFDSMRLVFASEAEASNVLKAFEQPPPPDAKTEPPWSWTARMLPPASEWDTRKKKRSAKEEEAKRARGEETKPPSAADAVAPWRDVPYEEQLKRKHELLTAKLAAWSAASADEPAAADAPPSATEAPTPAPLVRAPMPNGYRNKLDFTVGRDRNGLPCVGFRVGQFADGVVEVEGPQECGGTVPAAAIAFAAFASEFLRQPGRLPTFCLHTKQGFWRSITVRLSTRTRDMMVAMRANPMASTAPAGGKSAEPSEADWNEVRAFANAVARESFDGLAPTSVLVQWHDAVSSAPSLDEPYHVVSGRDSIEEEVLGMRFRVSAGSFFQVNTPGADALFGLARSLVSSSAAAAAAAAPDATTTTHKPTRTTLLDVCCGTGVIGLLLAGAVDRVVGVELSPPAVRDARENAKRNGLAPERARFVCASAESVMARLLNPTSPAALHAAQNSDLSPEDEEELKRIVAETTPGETFVAVVDPPRPGLNKKVLHAIRACGRIQRVVYVSCDPVGSFLRDAATLCARVVKNSKSASSGAPFRFVSASPVDLFPNTEHFELVAVLERDASAAVVSDSSPQAASSSSSSS